MNRPRYFGFVNSLGLSHMGIVLVLLIVGKAFFRTLQLLAAYSSGQFTFLKVESASRLRLGLQAIRRRSLTERFLA
jgi:hypothetical protein